MNQLEGRLHTFYENNKEGFEVAKEAITDLQEREKTYSVSYGAERWIGVEKMEVSKPLELGSPLSLSTKGLSISEEEKSGVPDN